MKDLLENDPYAALAGRCPRWISGIVGGERPSRYSESPKLWNALFASLALDAAFVAFDLPRAEDIPAFLKAFVDAPGALDLTVTNPYKAVAWNALPAIAAACGMALAASSRVEVLGCLNHLIVDRAGRRLVAENTDGVGMQRALESAYAVIDPGPSPARLPAGLPVLLAGSGGAAASIGLELVRAGARLTIVDLEAGSAERLASRLAPYAESPIGTGSRAIVPEVAPKSRIIVSAITVGSPLRTEEIAGLPAGIVFADARYGAAAEFAEAARGAGRGPSVVDGRAMLFGQFAVAAALACPIAGSGEGEVMQALSEMREAAVNPSRR
jgi:shikimate 5-dehydrogenase